MTTSRSILILFFLGMMFGCNNETQERLVTGDKVDNLEWLAFGEVKPEGWLLEQMEDDLKNGFVGHLDELVPDLIVEDEIYGKNRLTNKVKSKDVGAIGDGEWVVEFLWWNSETQSNWRDGWVRSAILTENTEVLREVDEYVEKMLSFQDEDGYMGIYAPDLRFNFIGENGELWAQSSLFRVLLGYYEATRRTEVLTAIERAVNVIMQAYPIGSSEPFNVKKPYGGIGHGLTIVDALDRLYQITGKQKYLDFAVWLYEDYNRQLPEEDIHMDNLNDSTYRFKGHGVHTYEHLRALVIAWKATGEMKYKIALDNYLEKLKNCLTPSGGPIGDEFILERHADASEIGYEYCSLQELLDSYGHLLQKSGELKWGDKMEWLFFNAAQGARHPYEHSIAYLKTDNSYSMTGSLHPGKEDVYKHNTRYSSSPVHQDAAVCCVPNAGRIPSYYVRSMWLKSKTGLVKSLYGPSVVNTKIDSVKVKIEEITNYPFNSEIEYKIETEKPVSFDLIFRKPDWTSAMKIMVNRKVQKGNRIEKEWKSGDKILIKFQSVIKQHIDLNGEYYFSYGPLVFALPLNSELSVTKKFQLNGFRNLNYTSTEQGKTNWEFSPGSFETFRIENSGEYQYGWESKKISAVLYNPTNQKEQEVELIPMGHTILRKVTFQKKQ